jgi:hypothetical protein
MLPNICSRYERMRCSRIKQHNYRRVLDQKHINGNIRCFPCFLYSNMVDSSTSIVLLGSNRNRVGSTGRCRCSCSSLIGTWARIQASIGKMTILSTSIALSFSLHWVLRSQGPLNILTSTSRSLEIVWALNHLTLQGRESLSSRLWSRLILRLDRTEHRSSCRYSNTWSGATA